MDSFVIKAVVDELRAWACPGIIKRVGQIDAFTLWLKIKGKREDWLIISTKSPFTGLYSTSGKPSKTPFETPFSMVLFKHVIGGEVIDISVQELERVVQFDIIPRKAGYRLQRQNLILELIDYNASVFLVEADSNRILASSRMDQKKERRIMPGDLYKPLTCLSKRNPLKMTASEWREFFLKRSPNEDLSVFLAHNLLGLSTKIAEEIVFRTGLSAHNHTNNVLLGDALWNCLQEVLVEYGSPVSQPIVIIYPYCDDLPVLTNLSLKSEIDRGVVKIFSTMNEAAEYFYKLIDQIRRFCRLKADLRNVISRAKKKYRKRLACLEKDLDMLQDAEKAKKFGDLLMAHLQCVTKGMSEITLPDLYHEGSEVSIPLDPAKNAVQNAKSYFKRYTKGRRGLTIVKERKAETEDLLHRLIESESTLANAKDLKALSKIEGFLRKILPQREMKNWTDTPSRTIPHSPKREKMLTGIRFFRIENSWDVFVGKTDMANDRLIRELSKSEDIWFHVYDAPGSHVVLKNPRRLENIPFNIIKKAAGVAAFFSHQRDEERVLVGYTRKKYVRKPKGLKPGQVLIDRQKTILIKPTLNGVIPEEK